MCKQFVYNQPITLTNMKKDHKKVNKYFIFLNFDNR